MWFCPADGQPDSSRMKLIAFRSAPCDCLKLLLSCSPNRRRVWSNSPRIVMTWYWAAGQCNCRICCGQIFPSFFFLHIKLQVLIVVVYGESLTFFIDLRKKKRNKNKIFLSHTSSLSYTLALFSVMESLWRLQGWMIVLICFGAAAPCTESALICSSFFDSPIMAECTDGRAGVSSRGASSHQLAPWRKTKLQYSVHVIYFYRLIF